MDVCLLPSAFAVVLSYSASNCYPDYDVAGPKGPTTSGVLGGYGRKATEAALSANEDTELRVINKVDLQAVDSKSPGSAPSFRRSLGGVPGAQGQRPA
jgi:hypothetical protein